MSAGWHSTRVLTAVLLVSLGLNLFFGGMLAGRMTGQALQEGSPTRRSIQAMLAPLPEAKRDAVRREIGAAMPRVRERFAAMQNARAALAQEMVKPTPDPAALERGFAEVQSHTLAIGTELQRAIARAMPSLTQEERRAMVQALARRQNGGAVALP